MTEQQLKQIAKNASLKNCKIYSNLFNELLDRFGINTYLRKCHFLAQIIHESGSFVYTEEIASGKAYEGRKDLGNIVTGDGIKFKGRGLIQITGRSNYTEISKVFGIDFLAHPELLETPEYAVRSAIWFWNARNLNRFADADDFVSITKRINGGTNGISQRKEILDRVKKILA